MTETKPKKVYRVRSVHEYKKAGEVKTYIRTRHFFSKDNARQSYERLLKAKENWGKQHGYDAIPIPPNWGKPISVQFSESEPLIFMDDETHLLDKCHAVPHT